MRLASWAVFGSLLINVGFGLVIAGGAVHAARPAAAPALAQCSHHTPGAARRPVSGHHLAAVRMGWAAG